MAFEIGPSIRAQRLQALGNTGESVLIDQITVTLALLWCNVARAKDFKEDLISYVLSENPRNKRDWHNMIKVDLAEELTKIVDFEDNSDLSRFVNENFRSRRELIMNAALEKYDKFEELWRSSIEAARATGDHIKCENVMSDFKQAVEKLSTEGFSDLIPAAKQGANNIIAAAEKMSAVVTSAAEKSGQSAKIKHLQVKYLKAQKRLKLLKSKLDYETRRLHRDLKYRNNLCKDYKIKKAKFNSCPRSERMEIRRELYEEMNTARQRYRCADINYRSAKKDVNRVLESVKKQEIIVKNLNEQISRAGASVARSLKHAKVKGSLKNAGDVARGRKPLPPRSPASGDTHTPQSKKGILRGKRTTPLTRGKAPVPECPAVKYSKEAIHTAETKAGNRAAVDSALKDARDVTTGKKPVPGSPAKSGKPHPAGRAPAVKAGGAKAPKGGIAPEVKAPKVEAPKVPEMPKAPEMPKMPEMPKIPGR